MCIAIYWPKKTKKNSKKNKRAQYLIIVIPILFPGKIKLLKAGKNILWLVLPRLLEYSLLSIPGCSLLQSVDELLEFMKLEA